MEEVDFELLNFLLQAPSKAALIGLCDEAFAQRGRKTLSKPWLSETAQQLNVKPAQASQLLKALCKLVHNAVFLSAFDAQSLSQLFPDDFHKNLRDLLVKVFVERLPQWKDNATGNLISLPRLVDFDWRVDVKTSADQVNRMSVPTCLVRMQIEEPPSGTSQQPVIEKQTNNVTVELSKETLDAMLDGLGKIRDQLSSVTNKT